MTTRTMADTQYLLVCFVSLLCWVNVGDFDMAAECQAEIDAM
jgi:hypothetical protein